MDLVKTVSRIEEKVEIEIPNEALENFTTPQIIIDYLHNLPKFQNLNRPREYLADKIWLIIEDEAGIERKDFNENSRLIEDMGMG